MSDIKYWPQSVSASSDPSQQSGTPSHVQDAFVHNRLSQVNSYFLQVSVYQKRKILYSFHESKSDCNRISRKLWSGSANDDGLLYITSNGQELNQLIKVQNSLRHVIGSSLLSPQSTLPSQIMELLAHRVLWAGQKNVPSSQMADAKDMRYKGSILHLLLITLTAVINFITPVSTIVLTITYKTVMNTNFVGALKCFIKLACRVGRLLIMLVHNTVNLISVQMKSIWAHAWTIENWRIARQQGAMATVVLGTVIDTYWEDKTIHSYWNQTWDSLWSYNYVYIV